MDQLKSILPITAGRDSAGRLTIAGQTLRELANQFGTPLYLYDAETVRGQVKRLREQLTAHYPGSYEITYAGKAYLSAAYACRLAQMDLGVDVVSLGEMAAARKGGFAPERVHLHGNNKSLDELQAAVEWGVQAIVVDSLEELETLEALAERLDRTARIWLRISPGVKVDSHSYLQTAHLSSKFGLPVEGGAAAEAIRRAMASKRLHLSGLHTHLGSQFFEAAPYEEALARLMELAEENGFVPEELSPGGGWGVPYLPGQPESDPGPWIQTVANALVAECQKRTWPLPRLVIEPGRWLSARAGLALYSVGTTKTTGDGTNIVAIDGGMADNPRPALYQAIYTAFLADRPDAASVMKASVVGKFCESGDRLIEGVELPEVHRGDLLVIPVAGAYQLSMASNYNLSSRPAVLWLEPGRVEVLQPREDITEGWWFR